MNANPLFAFLDGKRYTLDGVAGVLRHDQRTARYPYVHTVQRLLHVASAAGKRSEQYRTERTTLGDDYVTDLTDSIERYCSIAVELGYEVEVAA